MKKLSNVLNVIGGILAIIGLAKIAVLNPASTEIEMYAMISYIAKYFMYFIFPGVVLIFIGCHIGENK